ncbi:hypothetical protein Cob_v002270 [Colletotrichum orbiculare MAFF 240422]|uniref:Uncharacterized protein n=1 Tax=Colletotrichum orbiculare (strain 104-T / ATCC 96160 / CBS 514.97 / LARS 414 / MAFF 240422) TaxID=1213857 RepID=A0A484G436_COLOR|nr:hypothetical protein Cob_v002270 [Colletotrichum orbiculare MAFF 240422]
MDNMSRPPEYTKCSTHLAGDLPPPNAPRQDGHSLCIRQIERDNTRTETDRASVERRVGCERERDDTPPSEARGAREVSKF